VPLISASSIEKQISDRRCLTCAGPLEIDDIVCCKKKTCFGKLKEGDMSAHASQIITSINDALISEPEAVQKFSEETKNTIKEFFSKIASVEGCLQEKYIHYFLYLFWNDLKIKILDLKNNSKLWFTSQSKKHPILGSDAEPTLVRSIAQQIETDLIYINKTNETLYFVEVKRDSLCDRGVGQLYRYYEFISKKVLSEPFRKLNINYIKPVLILKNISPGYWKSFTSHFLENVHVYEFECTQKKDSIVLHDRKSQVLSLFHRFS